MKKYKCNCCNKIKSTLSRTLKPWESKGRQNESTMVPICRTCELGMKRREFKRVETYVNWIKDTEKTMVTLRRPAKRIGYRD